MYFSHRDKLQYVMNRKVFSSEVKLYTKMMQTSSLVNICIKMCKFCFNVTSLSITLHVLKNKS